jgi:hypothetical protein
MKVRKFRVKIIVSLRFLSTCYAISFHPRDTTRSIERQQWPYGTRPKTFAAFGLAIFLVCSNLNPVLPSKVTWDSVVGDLTPEQTVVFLDIMGIGVEDFVKYGTAEAIWPGSSPPLYKD